ncbi:hypothetical protein BGZ83_001966, partial [Gryganskiella cystojenkinii]
EEGSMFIESVGATTVEGWTRLKEKYCPPDEESQTQWSEIYGPILDGSQAAKASARVIEHSLFTYPDYSALRALSHRQDLGNGFRLFQYYFDRSIEQVDKRELGWGAHHGVDLPYVFGPDLAVDQVFNEKEKNLTKELQTMWILFAHGQTPETEIRRPVDDFDYHATHKEAIVFTEEAKIDRTHVSRQGPKVLNFWEKSEQWTHQMRYQHLAGRDGLRSGLLCVAQPGEHIQHAPPPTMSPTPPRVTIAKQGTVEGLLDPSKNVAKFLNIPYGVVQERWRPAVKPESWSGIRDATKQGPVSPQPSVETRFCHVINSYSQFDFDDDTTDFDAENCLNLNIFVHENTLKAASASSTQNAAVMVFIHGGGYKDGTHAMDIYDGSNLVRRSVANLDRPVIVVTMNYRLNFHGFFACPELLEDIKNDPKLASATDYDRAAGNWGLMDQRMALEWVRDHIHSFGGDASNVTVFGESYGSTSINYHMLIPQHRGLFHRAIMQSCAMNSAPAIRAEVEGKLYFDFLVEHFKIPKELSGKEKLERLRHIPGKELGLASASNKLWMFTPYVDGTMILEDVRLWTHKTEQYDQGVKTVIVGDTREEGSMFIEAMGATTVQGWTRLREKFCPPNQESLTEWDEVYGPVSNEDQARKASERVVEHSIFVYPDYSALRALSHRQDLGNGFQLFQYYFDRSIEQVDKRGEGLGAHHGIDLPYVFGPDFAVDQVFNEKEKNLMKEVQTMWILFAHGQTPETEIRRPVDDFDYHSSHKEAIVFSDEATIDREHVNRQGAKVFKLWEKSEQWTHQMRYQHHAGREGLRSGLLCIALPGEKDW